MLSIITLLILITLSITFLRLGFWQLSRASQRKTLSSEINKVRGENVILLTEETDPDQLQAWRSVIANGSWLHEKSVLIENRNYKGEPGYWLGTPFSISEKCIILVLRGWFPKTTPDQTMFLFENKNIKIQKKETITGELARNIPRLFELPSLKKENLRQISENELNKLQKFHNLEINDYKRIFDINLLPVILKQTNEDGSGLIKDWPNPSIDFNKNIGYAIQWFLFSIFCCIGWGFVLFEIIRVFLDKRNRFK